MEEASDEYEVNGWAISTSFVFPLLWKNHGLRIIETAVFTTKAEYEAHVFTSATKKKGKGGSKYTEIKRRKKSNLKLDELEYRYTKKSIKRGMNLWGVQRHIGYRGTILSETGGCRVLRDLSENEDGQNNHFLHAIKQQQPNHGKDNTKNTTLCIQTYIPPQNNIVYTATLKRQRPKYPNRNVGIDFDIIAESFGRSYFFPKTFSVDDVDGFHSNHAKVDIVTRQRARIASLAVAHHVENTHGIFFTELELEFLYDYQFKNELIISGVKRCQYIMVHEMWRWPVSEASMADFVKEHGKNPIDDDNKKKRSDSIHIKHHQMHHKHTIVSKNNTNKYAGGYADSSSDSDSESYNSDQINNRDGDHDNTTKYNANINRSIIPHGEEKYVDHYEEEEKVIEKIQPTANFEDVVTTPLHINNDTNNNNDDNYTKGIKFGSSKSASTSNLLTPQNYVSRRPDRNYSNTGIIQRPKTAGSRSMQMLPLQGHRSFRHQSSSLNAQRILSNPLRTAKSTTTLMQKPIHHTTGREAPAFIPSGTNKTSGHNIGGITLDAAFSDLKSLNPSATGSGDRWAAKKFKGLVDGWKDTRMQKIPASEKALDNIKVKRVGVDDLHIKMSKLLRIAHEKNDKLQAEIKRWIARSEKDVAALGEIEQICTQAQSRLAALEDKYKRESEKWLAENAKLNDLVNKLSKELKLTKKKLQEERLIFQDKAFECDELKSQLDNALAREKSYLARLALFEDEASDENKLRNELLKLRGEHKLLQEAHKVLVSEHEEVNEQYVELEKDNIKKDNFRNHLFKLLADRSTVGVNEPERKGGGFSSYPVPGKKNVERAVKMLCDGKFRPPPKRIRKGRNKAIRQLKHLREMRLKSEEYFNTKDVTVDAPSVFRQLRFALAGGRTLFGKKIKNLKDLFKVLDKDNGGTVSHDEFKAGLHRLDIGLTKDQVRALLHVVDDDQSGEIDIKEFLTAAREFSPTRIRKRKEKKQQQSNGGEEELEKLKEEEQNQEAKRNINFNNLSDNQKNETNATSHDNNMVKKATVGSDNATMMATNRNMNTSSSSGNIFNNDYGDKIRELSETI